MSHFILSMASLFPGSYMHQSDYAPIEYPATVLVSNEYKRGAKDDGVGVKLACGEVGGTEE